MFWIVETDDQLSKLGDKGYTEAYIDVVSLDPYSHPLENIISLVYIRPLNVNRGYLLCLNHSESLSIEKVKVEKYLKTFNILYTLDKKNLLHYFDINNLYDISLNGQLVPKHKTPAHKFFDKKEFDHINRLIPLSRHYEACERDFLNHLGIMRKNENPFYNKSIKVFNKIERNGLCIDSNIFSEHFYKTKSYIVYNSYNLSTTTSRPSNSYKGINYMALNKTSGCRKAFIPRNDYLMELDIKSFHPTLIAKLINYDFKGENPHSYLSKLYNKDYNESKLITFRQIYGGIYKEYKEIPFFQKTQEYINSLWESFTTNGYVEVPISKHKIYHKNNPDIKPQTLFNYLLQGYETALNVEILDECLNIMNGKDSKLVLYVYDSILMDIKDDEVNSFLPLVAEVFKKHKLKVKIKVGENYEFS